MISPNAIAATVTALASAISEKCKEEDIALLAAIFTQLGDTLTTISTAKERLKRNLIK